MTAIGMFSRKPLLVFVVLLVMCGVLKSADTKANKNIVIDLADTLTTLATIKKLDCLKSGELYTVTVKYNPLQYSVVVNHTDTIKSEKLELPVLSLASLDWLTKTLTTVSSLALNVMTQKNQDVEQPTTAISFGPALNLRPDTVREGSKTRSKKRKNRSVDDDSDNHSGNVYILKQREYLASTFDSIGKLAEEVKSELLVLSKKSLELSSKYYNRINGYPEDAEMKDCAAMWKHLETSFDKAIQHRKTIDNHRGQLLKMRIDSSYKRHSNNEPWLVEQSDLALRLLSDLQSATDTIIAESSPKKFLPLCEPLVHAIAANAKKEHTTLPIQYRGGEGTLTVKFVPRNPQHMLPIYETSYRFAERRLGFFGVMTGPYCAFGLGNTSFSTVRRDNSSGVSDTTSSFRYVTETDSQTAEVGALSMVAIGSRFKEDCPLGVFLGVGPGLSLTSDRLRFRLGLGVGLTIHATDHHVVAIGATGILGNSLRQSKSIDTTTDYKGAPTSGVVDQLVSSLALSVGYLVQL